MTGFGSAEIDTGQASVSVEVRSVNARHLRVRTSLPAEDERWAPVIRERVAKRVERGQVKVSVELETRGAGPGGLELDEQRVEALLRSFRKLREEHGLSGQVDLPLLVRAGGLLRESRPSVADLVDENALREVVDRAVEAMVEMREQEGERLAEDLRTRVSALQRGLDRVAELAPRRLRRERERLREAVAELVEDVDADDERLEKEIALLADKWDVSEERVRARSHLEGFLELLEEPSSEPVGKRMKFLVQELHREINTMGAKANDAEISREVVEMKNEIERMREQIENVE